MIKVFPENDQGGPGYVALALIINVNPVELFNEFKNLTDEQINAALSNKVLRFFEDLEQPTTAAINDLVQDRQKSIDATG